jgi:poly(3-hydroxybutyrate) depolymerase
MKPARSLRLSAPSMVVGLLVLGTACSPASPSSGTGGSQGSGGASATGGSNASGGQSATGGANGSGGLTGSGGATSPATGGTNGGTGGRGDAATGGAASGGRAGGGAGGPPATGSGGGAGAAGRGATGSGGAAGASGGSSGGSAGGTGSMASAGCDKARTLQNGTLTIMFNNASRKYILKVPDNYDNKHPYRLVVAYAESGSSAMSVAQRNYFTMATLDTGKTTIFVAPDAVNSDGSWAKSDVQLTDAILAQVEGDLCIDKTRIFATGFSFGGGMAIAVACTRADVFRGVAFFSGADLTGSCPAMLTKPIAYYASQASGDSSGTPMPSSGKVKQAEFAAVNGCTPEPNALNFPAAGQPHTCTDYKNCSPGHPVKYCIFDGPHGWEPKDPGQSMSWNAPEAWKFINQF